MDFKREQRYIVLKIKDLMESEVTQADLDTLSSIEGKVIERRALRGAALFDAVVVEQDWPEFLPTLAAIEARCRGVDGSAPSGPVFGVIDPDYARVFTMARCITWSEGYAAVMQGSFTRDLDILLVPWTDQARPDVSVVMARIADAADLRSLGEPTAKPHGRKAWSFTFKGFGDPRWIDLSAFAPAPANAPT